MAACRTTWYELELHPDGETMQRKVSIWVHSYQYSVETYDEFDIGELRYISEIYDASIPDDLAQRHEFEGRFGRTLPDDISENALVIVDESHASIPQIGGMYRGDRSRKETLVEYGFRLPSALDNRPLRFDEFEALAPQTIYVSATPRDYEREHSGAIVEQVVRPTGLVDPEVEVRPATSQVDDLLSEIGKRTAMGDRVLVTTLTKRMAEDLTEYYQDVGVRVRYLHSDVDTLERVEVIRDLRQGKFDVLHGWLKDNIYHLGSKYTAPELIERVTGGPVGEERDFRRQR